jgi:YD repeat-containing protein
VELIDANRHTTRFTYDRSNLQLSETRPGGQRLSYTYDGAGNLKTQTDGNGRHTIHTYDDRTRLTRTDIYEFTGAGAPLKTIDYFYNEADSLTGYDDGATSAVYSYGDQRQLFFPLNDNYISRYSLPLLSLYTMLDNPSCYDVILFHPPGRREPVGRPETGRIP